MKIRLGIGLLLLFVLILVPFRKVFSSIQSDTESPTAWAAVASGIDYQKFHLVNPRPVNIFVTRMDRSNPNNTIDSSIAQGKLASGRESITGMAARSDEAINYWGATRGGGWGERNHVVAAINGYFFDGATGTPWSGVAQSGWYAKRFDDTIGDAGFTWTLNRTAHLGSCVYHIGNKNSITFPKAGYTINIKGLDVPPGDDDLILYTPLYDQDTNTPSTPDAPVLELLVEMTRPTLILPSPAYALGYIREIHDGSGSTLIPFDHVVISVWGNPRSTIEEKIASGEIAIGDPVNFSQEIKDCLSSPQNNWTKTYATIGGDYHFLNNGVIRTDFNNPDASVRNSRTAIAFNDNYVFFIVVDAFDLNVSEGVTIAQLGDFTKNTLGAIWGVTMDSGTSSTMVINGQVVNNTKCNFTRDCGMQVTQADKLQHPNVLPLETTYETEWTDASGAIEPLVGSGMLMVVSEPMVRSATFSPYTAVATNSASSIHLGPGNNYAYLATIPAGASGNIVPPLNNLNGVLAKGSFWWKVSFGGVVGWIREQNLVGGRTPSEYNYRIFMPSINKSGSAIFGLEFPEAPSLVPSPTEVPISIPNDNNDLTR
jgi:Phosphodiester glycosidase